ncbi:putative uncharacterized protein DDB_G0282499 [Bombyx mori]|uniref:putative uncharacterized protein DDB_G0282499 n=1 Tax=Bombyx mori TaxID=7091 RepID=UPI002ED35201
MKSYVFIATIVLATTQLTWGAPEKLLQIRNDNGTCTNIAAILIVFRIALSKQNIENDKIDLILNDAQEMLRKLTTDKKYRFSSLQPIPKEGEFQVLNTRITDNEPNSKIGCRDALKLMTEFKMSTELINHICQNELSSMSSSMIDSTKNINLMETGFTQRGSVRKLPDEVVKNIIISFYNFKPKAFNNLFDTNDNINSDNLKQLNDFIIQQSHVKSTSSIDQSGNIVYKVENPEAIQIISEILNAVLMKLFDLHKNIANGPVSHDFNVNKIQQNAEEELKKYLSQDNVSINLFNLSQDNLTNKKDSLINIFGNKIESPENNHAFSKTILFNKYMQKTPEVNPITNALADYNLKMHPKQVNADQDLLKFGNDNNLPLISNKQNQPIGSLVFKNTPNTLTDKPVLEDFEQYLKVVNNLNKAQTIDKPVENVETKAIPNELQKNGAGNGILELLSKSPYWNQIQEINQQQNVPYPSFNNNLLQLQTIKNTDQNKMNMETIQHNINTNNINIDAMKNKDIFVELTYIFNIDPFVQTKYVKYRVPIIKLYELLLKKPILKDQPTNLYHDLVLVANVSDVSADLQKYSKEDLLTLTLSSGRLSTAKMIEENNIDNQLHVLQKLMCNVEPKDILELHKQNILNGNGDNLKMQQSTSPSQNLNMNSLVSKAYYQQPLWNNWKASLAPNFLYSRYLTKPVQYFWQYPAPNTLPAPTMI